MGLTNDTTSKIPEEAALWVQRLRHEDSPAMRAEFSAWVGQGTRHLEEFLFAQALWKEMDHIDRGTRDRLWPKDDEATVVPLTQSLPSAHQPLVRRGKRRLRQALAASVTILGVALLAWMVTAYMAASPGTYATTVGEQKTVKLADGSLMQLNTDSQAVVSFTDAERTIRLAAGEALFSVSHDPRRPFVVLTDTARVRAIGTQFNVYKNSTSGTRVAVIEGVVQVSPLPSAGTSPSLPTTTGAGPGQLAILRLEAGHEATVERGQVVQIDQPDIERAVSWRQRKLMFPGNDVSEIVEEFNRYNDTPIRIEGSDLASRRMSGVFDADDPSPLIDYLSRDPDVEIIRGEHAIVIRSRRP